MNICKQWLRQVIKSATTSVAATVFFFTLTSCGGGGSSSVADNGGIGGSGITATGSIDGFGSIFVNGIEFETDSANVVLDGRAALESDLRLGMVVVVRGSANGSTGIANSVEFDDEVQGPIESITPDLDDLTKTLEVLGVTVVVDRLSTVFDDVTFETLAIDDVLEVSGFFDESSALLATRVERKESFTPGSSEIEVKGSVTSLQPTTFDLGTFNVNYSGAILSGFSGGLMNGQFVEVKGTLQGNDITATEVELEDGPFADDEDNVSIEGIITDFNSLGDFRIAGQQVDASGALLIPASLALQNGLKVEAEGAIVNGVLDAREVEARAGEIRLSAHVSDIGANPGEVTLGFAAGSVSFTVNNQTELRDETGVFEPLEFTDIRTGDFLEVKALHDGSAIVATEVRLENTDDEVIQGPVESFTAGTEITIFGISFLTPGEIFEDANDAFISSANFFLQLSVGDIVKIEDDDPANGTADEVEFED